MATLIAQETRYFTADKTEVVGEGDPRAAFLLVRKGSPVDAGVAQMYGIPTEALGSERVPMPGANVETPEFRAARLATEATRRATLEMQGATDAAHDGATGRQVAGAIEGKVARETGQPASQAARAVLDHQRDSLEGSDLFTGVGAKGSEAYDPNREGGDTADNAGGGAPGAGDLQREQAAGADSGDKVNAKTREIAAPGAAGEGVRQTGTGQGYEGSSGVAVPGAGQEAGVVSSGGATGGALGSTALAPGAQSVDARPATAPPDTQTANAPHSPDASESNAGEAARLDAERAGAAGAADTSASTLGAAKDKAEDKINPPSGV